MNVVHKEAEKKLKHKRLCIQIQACNINSVITPVITGSTSTVSNGSKNLEATPGKHPTYSVQNTAVLGTSHVIRKVLQAET